MRTTRLLRSSTFRVTVVYLCLFLASAIAILAFVYLYSARFMEQQTQETLRVESEVLLEPYRNYGFRSVVRGVEQRANESLDKSTIYFLLDARNMVVAGTTLGGFGEPLPTVPGYSPLPISEAGDAPRPDRHYLLLRTDLPGGGALVVGRDITDKLHTQNTLRRAIYSGLAGMVLLGFAGGVIMSRWMLRRIEAVNRTTQQIMAGDLGQRIKPAGTDDEFDGLINNLNAMLERIERLMKGMRQVSDNVAHDLRTPLNRIRSRLESALISDPDAAESREVLEQTLRDADALIATFNALLSIARIEAGAPQSEWETVDLAELAADVVELYEPLAEEKDIVLRQEHLGPATAVGNRQLIAQALANLVDNAIKYTPERGRVDVRASATGGAAIEVADSGPGIPDNLREQALQRFVRLDPERSTPGNGLGLSLVQAVAKLHDADLRLDDNNPGLRVTLRFRPLPPTLARAPAPAMVPA
ncbi:MAG: HAMP domain-containing sensor histidine kinase [Geminicoccaceae bacterium]